jgi:DNA-binding Xre family transcriptional regulator
MTQKWTKKYDHFLPNVYLCFQLHRFTMIELYLKPYLTSRGLRPVPFTLEKMGLKRNESINLLRDTTKLVKFSTLHKLCSVLHCTPNDLLTYKPRVENELLDSHPLQKLKKIEHPENVINKLQQLNSDQIDEVMRKIDELVGS